MFGVGHGLAEQRPDVIVVKGVGHMPSISLTDDQSEVPQHPELLRHRRLLHVDLLREHPNGARSGPEPAEDADTTRGRQRLHRLGDRTRSLTGEKAEPVITSMTHERIIA
jgi:hypothetical protein